MKAGNAVSRWLIGFFFAATMVFFEGCGTSAITKLYVEPSVRNDLSSFKRVAIVPNRMPLNLQDPEYWRLNNWTLIRDKFVAKGYSVIDYKTSVEAFNGSGLPMEDTKSSRDKYADLAKELGADLIIIPYYGAFTEMKMILLATQYRYIGVVTLQIFDARKNDFIMRMDGTGVNEFTNGILTTFSMVPLIIGFTLSMNGNPDGGSNVTLVGGIGCGVGLLSDLINLFRSAKSRWNSAFEEAILKGLEPFFAMYGGLGSTGGSPANASTPVVENPVMEVPHDSNTPPRPDTVHTDSASVKTANAAPNVVDTVAARYVNSDDPNMRLTLYEKPKDMVLNRNDYSHSKPTPMSTVGLIFGHTRFKCYGETAKFYYVEIEGKRWFVPKTNITEQPAN